ncbi:MAG: aldo/keto reductase [Acidimicrobiia bacterium]|nr:aldo/keto reductase [Acidimicrobiia bacterium]
MIEHVPFGRTGHRSSRVIFGAAALGHSSDSRRDQLLALLDEHGINHIDTAASYGDSERHVAVWLAERRRDFFVATKTGERTGDGARAELERSLQRLGTDHVDLIQLHNLVEEDEWRTVFSPGGAVESLARARAEGLVHHIGVTGHGLRIAAMHQRSLAEFAFDSVLLPYSHILLRQPDYAADVDTLLGVCADQNVAVQTIKAVARRRWPDDHDGPKYSWYQPLEDPEALTRSVHHVLAHPQLFLNTTSDSRLLPVVFQAAADHDGSAPDPVDLDADLVAAEAAPIFDGGALERI